jgi:putative sugar O-methyltransferase
MIKKNKFQAKKKSLWSTFKNAYLRQKNLKTFWNKLDKINLSKELIKTFNLYLNSESYNWTSKFWRHLTMLHIDLIASGKYKNYENILARNYFTWTEIDEDLIKDSCKAVQYSKINLNVNLFKKQDNLNFAGSMQHNLILLLLYENIKLKKVFKYLIQLNKFKKNNSVIENSLNIDGLEITQDNLNSLIEYEQIEKLLGKLSVKKNKFLEVGAGSGRTAKIILSINDKAKYVIADLPPAINVSFDNLKAYFPDKKIAKGFELDNQEDLNIALEKNDILFVFPHQIRFFPKKTFDISIAIDCLHEMEKKIIKDYMVNFEHVSKLLYFKVWEYAGLPYSFFQHYSVHRKEDYFIKDAWKEHLKERCLYPSKFFELGYEF